MTRVYKCLILGLLIFISKESQACDVCGCAVNGMQFGIIPQFKKHFAGVKGTYRSFTSTHHPLFSHEKQSISQESFMTIDIWSRWLINDRIQIFALFPLHHIEKQEDAVISRNSGIGDISMSVLYSILDNKKNSTGNIIHQLQIGGGIKLPTGHNNKIVANDDWVPGFQLGTGTLDFTANINYIIRFKKSGIMSELGYRWNQLNKKHNFEFGDRLSSSLKYFYVFNWKGKTWMPSAGLTHDFASQDFHEGDALLLSGGNALFGHVGMDFFSPLVNGGFFVQPAVYNNVASGNLVPHTRYGAHINLFF